jgi:hypothetical protein
MKLQKIPFWWLLLATITLNILAQAIHEGGHWAIYQVTGHRPVWAFTSIVQVWNTPPQQLEGWVATTAPDGEKGWLKLSSVPGKTVEAVDDAAGPLMSLVSVIAGLLFYRLNKGPAVRVSGLVLAIITSLLMTFYYARSGTRIGGDEGFLAASLGIPKMIFDIPLGLAFLTCLLLGLRELKTWKNGLRFFGALLPGMILSAGSMVLLDPSIRSGVAAGNPFFRSVLGFSLPVFVVYCLAIVGLILLGRKLNILEKLETDGQSVPA